MAPSEFSDKFVALTDSATGFVEVWSLASNGSAASVVAHVDIDDGGCCANAVVSLGLTKGFSVAPRPDASSRSDLVLMLTTSVVFLILKPMISESSQRLSGDVYDRVDSCQM